MSARRDAHVTDSVRTHDRYSVRPAFGAERTQNPVVGPSRNAGLAAASAEARRKGQSVRVLSPASVLTAWFAAHAADDMEAARALMADDAMVNVPGVALCGFDAFMDWYARRRSAHPAFQYDVLDILGGERHAAAVIRLSDGSRTWRQVAVYEIADSQIASMTAYEDDPSA